ncbi:hypothetical protein MKEN_01125200 [Mycena kentingensis (nom. inval.)]|nr:hypothetical protein MKEN_01125200 [Mycena kentingensis (nom. inval.)]
MSVDAESQTAPLLAPATAHPHTCASCGCGISKRSPEGEASPITVRGALISLIIVLCLAMFSLSIVIMATSASYYFSAGALFVCLWSYLTVTVCSALVYATRPHRRFPCHRLGKTLVQIKILVLLALSWIPIICSVIADSASWTAHWNGLLGLFIPVDIFAIIVTCALLGAAIATYRRAVTVHGKHLVPHPGMVPAWTVSDIRPAEGGVKL